MPIYDYRCTDCGSTYDVFHKVREVQEDIVCPSCGSLHHQRLIGAPNFAMSTKSGSAFSTPQASSGCSTEEGGCCGGSCGLN